MKPDMGADHDPDYSFCTLRHRDDPLVTILNPFDEDGYCCWCGNGRWKFHMPGCRWADIHEPE